MNLAKIEQIKDLNTFLLDKNTIFEEVYYSEEYFGNYRASYSVNKIIFILEKERGQWSISISKNGKDDFELKILMALITYNEKYLTDVISIGQITNFLDKYWEQVNFLFAKEYVLETIEKLISLRKKSIRLSMRWLFD